MENANNLIFLLEPRALTKKPMPPAKNLIFSKNSQFLGVHAPQKPSTLLFSMALQHKIRVGCFNKQPLSSNSQIGIRQNRLRVFLSTVEQRLCYLSFLEISYNKLPPKEIMPSLKKALKQAPALALSNLTLQKSTNRASLELDSLVNLLINWLFHERMGFFVENVLTKVLHKNTLGQAFFQECFLRYQKQHLLSFYRNKPINGFELETISIFYKKVNILKLIRFILKTYNSSFFKTLTLKQQYTFARNVVLLTRQSGSYKYINYLFYPLVWEPHKQIVKVSDKDIFLPDLGSSQPTTLAPVARDSAVTQTSNRRETKDWRFFVLRYAHYGVISLVAFLPLLSANKMGSNRLFFSNQNTVQVLGEYKGPLARLPFAVLSSSVNLSSKSSTYVATSQALSTNKNPTIGMSSRQHLKVSSALTVPQLDSKDIYTTVFLPGQVTKADLKNVLSLNHQIDNIPLFVHVYSPQTEQHEYLSYSCSLKPLIGSAENKNPNLELWVGDQPLTQAICSASQLGTKSIATDKRTLNSNSFIIYMSPSNFTEKGFEELHLSVPINYNLEKKTQEVTHLAKEHFKKMASWIESDNNLLNNIKKIYSAELEAKLFKLLKILKKNKGSFSVNIVTSEAAHFNPELTSGMLGFSHNYAGTLFTHKEANRPFDTAKANRIDATASSFVEFVTASLKNAMAKYNEIIFKQLDKIAAGTSDENPLCLLVVRDFNKEFFYEARLAIATLFKKEHFFFYNNASGELNDPLYQMIEPRLFINLYTMYACKANYQKAINTLDNYLSILRLQLNSDNREFIKQNKVNASSIFLDPKNSPTGNSSNPMPTGFFLSLSKELTKVNTDLTSCINGSSAIKFLAIYNATLHSFLAKKTPEDLKSFLEKTLNCFDAIIRLPTASNSNSSLEASNSSGSTGAANQQLDTEFLGEMALVGADKRNFLSSLEKIKLESTRVFRYQFTEITKLQQDAEQTLCNLQEQLDLQIIKHREYLAECDRAESTIEEQNLTKQQIIKKKKAISLKRQNVNTQEAGAINTLQVQIEQIKQTLEKLNNASGKQFCFYKSTKIT